MSDKKKNFDEDATNILHLENQASVEIMDLDYKVRRYESLIKFGQLISSSLEYKNLQKKAVIQIKKLVECEKVLIYRIDPKKNKLVNRTFEDHKVVEEFFEINEDSFVGSCAHFGAILHIREVDGDKRINNEITRLKKLDLENMLLLPIISKGELLGVIQAVNSLNSHFNDDDIHFAEALAGQLGGAIENSILFERLNKQFYQVVEAMADAIGKKDSYTGGHTKRVKHFSEMIGRELGLNSTEMKELRLSAIIHDVGKIGIADKILNKKAPLNEEEFQIMKNHPRFGYEILGHIEGLGTVTDGMRFHHERPDGRGYPYGLKGEEIPQIAMIISVADTFDAMISTRPYRKGLDPMIAYHEILDNRGSQFSEKVVDAFARYFRKSGMYREQDDQYLKQEIKKAS